jgi:hypothetical protein
MLQAPLLKLLVTVWLVGQPPISELLPKEYPTSAQALCAADAKAIIAKAREGVKAQAECVEAEARGS